MATRCKVRCTKVTKTAQTTGSTTGASVETGYTAEFYPVIEGSPENKEFYKWTPGGKFDLQTLRGDHFEAGKEYYVDFTPAEG